MNAHVFLGRVAAARHATSRLAIRQFSTSRFACAAYHSYSLPTPRSSADARPDELVETSIAYPEALPRVHETRPPPSSPASPTPAVAPSQPPAQAAAAPASSPSPMAQQQPVTAAASALEKQPQKAKPTRPRSKLRPRKAAMKLTPAAVEQLRNLLDQPEPKLIKVGVRNRGCSGLAYHLEFVDKPGAFDETVEQDGVRVLIDSKALFSIIGSEMDWAEDKLSQRFVFRNPNIKEECGCGESFMV
ncbi:iron sulfur assembly 1 [Cordyceps militaris]|uniref:Iron-sulfur assembly protein 1 n=1 Tax=Cordyceps militaris TaxID=73501 RepID=A0A2H4SDX8_CORMI|nr:iron sulfur assembly 1 [Cordyceps militaris]